MGHATTSRPRLTFAVPCVALAAVAVPTRKKDEPFVQAALHGRGGERVEFEAA
ncbi:MAG TPA: hypothetical protein VHE83_16325 [Mycobacteriales bacterium]|nr:hypothetical protein [Mycobacteriales bacterium]